MTNNNNNHNNNPLGKGGFKEHPENINKSGTKGSQGLRLLREAMEKRATKEGITLYDHFAKLAFHDKQILIEAMKKLVPSAQSITVDGGLTLQDFMSKLRGEIVNDPTDDMDTATLGDKDESTDEDTNEPTDK